MSIHFASLCELCVSAVNKNEKRAGFSRSRFTATPETPPSVEPLRSGSAGSRAGIGLLSRQLGQSPAKPLLAGEHHIDCLHAQAQAGCIDVVIFAAIHAVDHIDESSAVRFGEARDQVSLFTQVIRVGHDPRLFLGERILFFVIGHDP
jgi:hypothetical protein